MKKLEAAAVHDEDELRSSMHAVFSDSDKEIDDPEDSAYIFWSIGFQC